MAHDPSVIQQTMQDSFEPTVENSGEVDDQFKAKMIQIQKIEDDRLKEIERA